MPMSSTRQAPLFSVLQLAEAKRFYDDNGFVAFRDLLDQATLQDLLTAAEEAYPGATNALRRMGGADNRDMMFAHPAFERMVRDRRLWGMARELLGHPVEVQHTKYNGKMPDLDEEVEVDWHQDYPFYPHTNFDLVSALVHLDDEGPESGPLTFLPGTHLGGPRSHSEDGVFRYRCTEDLSAMLPNRTPIYGPSGVVSFHHCLTLHWSGPNRGAHRRRFLITQYRAQDAAQVGGVLWKATGYQVDPDHPRTGHVRFPDGTIVENRGREGRLYDVGGVLVPDR